MSHRQSANHQGRIPFRLRIGVTGHRKLVDEEAIAGQVRGILHRIRELVPSSSYTSVLFTVVSPLAEGANRLVAREVLKIEGGQPRAAAAFPGGVHARLRNA